MKAVEAYRNEHRSLLEVAERIKKTLEGQPLGDDNLKYLFMSINTLMRVATVHIVVEDGDFYPRVRGLGNRQVADSIDRMGLEAARIEQAIASFEQAWDKKKAKRAFASFRDSVLSVIALLCHRIEAEEAIFSLLEKGGVDLSAISTTAESRKTASDPRF